MKKVLSSAVLCLLALCMLCIVVHQHHAASLAVVGIVGIICCQSVHYGMGGTMVLSGFCHRCAT